MWLDCAIAAHFRLHTRGCEAHAQRPKKRRTAMAHEPIPFLETTVDAVHAGMKTGAVHCTQLVQWYLDRIQQYDRQGPALHAIVNVNPQALEQAAALDRHLKETGKFKGPLHGIPILVKDQGETSFMPTTFGSKAYADYQPAANAAVVQKLIDAGALILAKASMCDFAAGWFSFSSVTDRTRNPYALDRDAGGSSAGTGAGVAANFGLVGIGEDTGGSIRIPASFNNLFGLRVTTGLISRTGFSPLLHFQDTAGPMARSVRDLAKLLDVLVGYDERDPYTCAVTLARDAGNYERFAGRRRSAGSASWRAEAGFRPGRCLLAPGQRGDSRPAAAARRARRGTDRSPDPGPGAVDRPDLSVCPAVEVRLEPVHGHPHPAQIFEEIYEKRWFHPLNDLFHNLAAGPDNPDQAQGYYQQRQAQAEFQRLILNLYARHRLDFLLYPDVKVLPPTYADLESGKWTCLTFPTNTVIASQAHLPAISIPAGFADQGVPVGVELVAPPYAEASLLRFACAYEQLIRPTTSAAAPVVAVKTKNPPRMARRPI